MRIRKLCVYAREVVVRPGGKRGVWGHGGHGGRDPSPTPPPLPNERKSTILMGKCGRITTAFIENTVKIKVQSEQHFSGVRIRGLQRNA